jgi:alkanesulfonate monooxygenase SsuD/methylene tetrahydromethanopterin reductase-like flavin-dependent oxidoreductase (luciferase family)
MPPSRRPTLGFGLVARVPPVPEELAALGPRLEALGYGELWANDGRHRSGLATLAVAGGSSPELDLGVGVVPLSERSPEQVVAEVRALRLPLERLILGVGTGDGSSLAAVREGVVVLRRLLPGTRLAIAALGPRMCRLGGEVADVVLLNWAFPDRIAWSRERIAEGAAAAGREPPRVAGYVRVAIGPDARERLAAEADRYRGRPRPYVRLFSEQDAMGGRVPGVAAERPEDVPRLLAPYREALDGCVVRALPAGESVEELIAIAEAAAEPARPAG